MNNEIKETNKKIADLQQKLGVSVTEEQNNPSSDKLKTCPNHDKAIPKKPKKGKKKAGKKLKK